MLGMLTSRRGEINAVFVVSEDLLHALVLIRGPLMSLRDWGPKPSLGQEEEHRRWGSRTGRSVCVFVYVYV